MGDICALCGSFYGNPGIGFHRIPTTKGELDPTWVQILLDRGCSINKGTRVCTRHFESGDFEIKTFKNTGGTRRLLKRGIYPTIFPPRYDVIYDKRNAESLNQPLEGPRDKKSSEKMNKASNFPSGSATSEIKHDDIEARNSSHVLLESPCVSSQEHHCNSGLKSAFFLPVDQIPVDQTSNQILKVLEYHEQTVGTIACGKMSDSELWPCVILDYWDINQAPPKYQNQWVLWYGNFSFSEISHQAIFSFPSAIKQLRNKLQGACKKTLIDAVVSGAKDYCWQFGEICKDWTIQSVLTWFQTHVQTNACVFYSPYPPDILQYIENVKRFPSGEVDRILSNYEKLSKDLQGIRLKPEEFCSRCFERGGSFQQHPLFHASICQGCFDEFWPTCFAFSANGDGLFCCFCGRGESVRTRCEELDCRRGYCSLCIKYIFCPDNIIIGIDDCWSCFLCRKDSSTGLIHRREEFEKHLLNLYAKTYKPMESSVPQCSGRKSKVRVLSLFDGIAVGLAALEKLGLSVECYYASEIDMDALAVTQHNHGEKIVQIGDVKKIDGHTIAAIAPIDLLIGGPPCQDLSLVNPRRKGLDDPHGTGCLFYEYLRIRNLLFKHNGGCQLFWLMENTAAMPKIYKQKINESLGCSPYLLDSALFCPMRRPRLYWTNLPWGSFKTIPVVLQDVLTKGMNRYASVKKINTVTTKGASLLQGKTKLQPVMVENRGAPLTIQEIERIFGLLDNYTDVGLSRSRRQRLLGQSWSCCTVSAILSTLRLFFEQPGSCLVKGKNDLI